MKIPVFVFAHGAGAPSSHPWMQRWKQKLGTIGPVVIFDYPYMQQRKSRPDPLPRLLEAHREVLEHVRREHEGPVILIGKSLGARVGCHLALSETVAALVCLGYPLCANGDRDKLRADVLRGLETPILFVQGTRDRLCPLDLLDKVRSEMKAANELYIVDGGDHSLMVTKARLEGRNETQNDVEDRILERIREFVGPEYGQD